MVNYADRPHLVVSAFVYYMGNAWSEEEAVRLYGKVMGEHFWHKWVIINSLYKSGNAASLGMYTQMSGEYREKLVAAAMARYAEGDWLNNQ